MESDSLKMYTTITMNLQWNERKAVSIKHSSIHFTFTPQTISTGEEKEFFNLYLFQLPWFDIYIDLNWTTLNPFHLMDIIANIA